MTGGHRPRSAVVIINPLSGRGRHQSQIEAHIALAHDVLTSRGISTAIRPTTRAGDAHAFAREAVTAGCDLVVAWGGDGTINEAASALVHTDVPLGIVPAGSGNGLASDLLVPFDARAALHLAATGRSMAIDAGRVDDCLFFNIAGVGIDAVIAARFNTRGMQQRGFAAYLQLSTAELLRYRCQTYEISIEQDRAEYRALLVAFANGRQYGNRLLIAPGARLDDGLLEVVVIEQLSLASIAWRLPSLFRGTLQPGRGVTMRAATDVRIRSSGPIPFHVDGEPRLGGEQLYVQTIPGALTVRVTAM
ncbi:MAG TPA: diacylglycerol kinase family protein [Vicinamibacterales bacterium]|nr:diacylglycerol kinase family protein [Vicinamibacterales bacterium]